MSLTLEFGQVVLLCGPSGSGKTTLCQLLSGELDPTSGTFEGAGGRIATMSADVESQLLGSTVSQELGFGLSAGSEDAEPPPSPELKALRLALVARWAGRESVDPHDLSSGEQQLLLLTSLAMGPSPLLILDEGLSSLDQTSFLEIFPALRALAGTGVLVLLVSHELRVLPWVDRCVSLDKGQLAFDRAASSITWTDLAKVRFWTGSLVQSSDPYGTVLTDSRVGLDRPLSGLGGIAQGQTHSLGRFAELELRISPSEILAVGGGAGSGKSRWLLALANLAELPGWDSENFPLYRVLLPEPASGTLWHRTVRAELEASLAEGRRRGSTLVMTVEDLGEVPEIWLERSPRSLSRGEGKLIGCLCLLLQLPDLLLLDEPFSGMDAHLRACLETRLRAFLQGGGRVVFSTHHPDEMILYATRLLVLNEGRPSFLGDPESYFRGSPDPRLGVPYAWGLAKTPT